MTQRFMNLFVSDSVRSVHRWTFAKIIPPPSGFKSLAKDQLELPDDEMKWFNSSWGTKWGAKEVQVTGKPTSAALIYTFQTAWNPPLPIIEAIGNLFPDLKMKFVAYEDGKYGVVYYLKKKTNSTTFKTSKWWGTGDKESDTLIKAFETALNTDY